MYIEATAIPESRLTLQQREHLRLARTISYRPVVPAHLKGDEGVHVIGAYRIWSGVIYVTPGRLDRARSTVDTTIHELAHHESMADDGTQAHDRAIAQVSARVAEKAGTGAYDKVLVDAVW